MEYDGDILAEAWELSCHPDGPSVILNGPYEGKTLREYLDLVGMEALGTHCRRFREFPILTKFIDARDMIEPLREMMERDCFGGEHGMIPEIAVAELGSNAGMIGAANL